MPVGTNTNGLALERFPHDTAEANRVFCDSSARDNLAVRYIDNVDHAYCVVVAVAGAFNVFKQLIRQVLSDSMTKKGRMEIDNSFDFMDEVHFDELIGL